MTDKAAIYVRVSTHWQADKDSIQVQRRELSAYCDLVLGIKSYEIFEDAGFSAKNTDRPEYQHMMGRIMSGEFSHLLVWKIDRISRNLLDFSAMYKDLKRLGVVFISKNEQFDTSTAIGEAMLKIILVFAELERKMTSERVSAVMLSRANNGQWNGGRIPYGYDYDRKSKTFSVNAEQAKNVKRMYALYMQSKSLTYVSNKLNEEGITSNRGNAFSPVAIHKILNNPFTYGKYQYNRFDESDGQKRKDESEIIVVDNHHEAILPPEDYDKIRNVMSGNKRFLVHNYTRKYVHPFAGLMYCGKCGRVMNTTIDRPLQSGFAPSIHTCGGRRNATCKNKAVNDSVVAPFVFTLLSNILLAYNSIGQLDGLDNFNSRVLENLKVKSISGTEKLFELAKSGVSGFEYKQTFSSQESELVSGLISKKKKLENALNRLQSLYLYSDESLPEKDYLIQRERILKELESVSATIVKSNVEKYSDGYEEKASYFIMIKQLTEGRLDYEKNMRSLSPSVIKDFLCRVLKGVYVDDGKIIKVVLKNGIELKFGY